MHLYILFSFVTYAYEGVCVCHYVCEWVNKEMPNIMKNVIASWTDMFNIILRKYNDAKAVAFREPCSLEGKKGGYLIPTKNVLVWKETIEIGPCEGKSPLGENEEKRESFSGKIFIDTLVWLFRVYNVAA